MQITTMYFILIVFFISMVYVHSDRIEVSYCEPPDFPEFGGYGPLETSYTPGDTIHYFCNTSYYIGGNYLRVCLDSGDWTGDTPVCDPPADFDIVSQTSVAEPSFRNGPDEAVDSYKYSCSSTEAGPNQEWSATYKDISQVLRVMLFLPKGEVAYEVFIVKQDNSEFSCGRKQGRIERLEWTFHNCIEPHNTGVVALKIKSLSSTIPLRLCEVVSHVLTNPTCTDPHVPVESGRLILSRKRASLSCLSGYRKGPNTAINCIRTGVWQRKQMYCIDTGVVESLAEPCSGNHNQS